MTLTFIPVKGNLGIEVDIDKTKSESRINLTQALDMHSDILLDIKETLAINMLDALSKLDKPTIIYLADVIDDVELTDPKDLFELYKYFQCRNWVSTEVYKLRVEAVTKEPTRIIKRIVSRLEAKANPHKHFNRINDDDIERAREYPIEEMFEGVLHPAGGGRQKGVCPFHKEKSASFYIFKDNKAHCFGCQYHSDAIGFYMRLHEVEFIQAVKALTRS